MFADDIALIYDTIKGLKSQLNNLENVCKLYHMIVNVVKTKVMVFRLGGRLRANERFFYKGAKLEIRQRFLKYWLKFLKMPNDRYVRKCYDMLYHFDALGYKNWASEIRNILSINCFLYVLENQGVENEGEFLRSFAQRLKDQFLQVWKSKIDESSKLSFYTQIKVHHCLESYLDILKINKFHNALASFRVSCHVLEIEKGIKA